MDIIKFIEKAKHIHGNKYDYSLLKEITSRRKGEIICPKHGSFWQTTSHVNQKCGCPKCAKNGRPHLKTKSINQFIQEAKYTHQDKFGQSLYDYNCTLQNGYKNNYTKLPIKCLKENHGIFWQTPNMHIHKLNGCHYCKLPGTYNIQSIQNTHYEKLPVLLYMIRLQNETESFYKIGYTTKTVINRFMGSTVQKYYKLEKINEKEMSLIEALQWEIYFKTNYSDLKYTPKYKFSGYTECFSKELYDKLFGKMGKCDYETRLPTYTL